MYYFFSNSLNPILVKEVRQFVRNRLIVLITNLYICLLLLASISILLQNNHNAITFDAEEIEMLVFLCKWTCFFAVILRTAWSTSVDKINEDLMFYSSIKPSTIVFGKLLCGTLITLILMSITAPFITLFFLIGGINLPHLIILFVFIFVTLQVLNALAVLIASTSKMRFAHFATVLTIAAIGYGFMHIYTKEIFNMWSFMEPDEMLLEFLGFLFASVSLFLLIISVTIAKFSPQNSNRLLPMRIIVMIIFISTVCAVLSEKFLSPLQEVLVYFEVICLLTLMLFLVLTICERNQWSWRIRHNLPKSVLGRIILFPFCTGSPSGLVWLGIMFATLIVIDRIILLPLNSFSSRGYSLFWTDHSNEICMNSFMPICVLFFNYCVTAMLIQSWLLKKISHKKTWLIVMCLIMFVSFCCMLAGGVYNGIYYSFSSTESSLSFINDRNWLSDYRNHWISSIDLINFIDCLYSLLIQPQNFFNEVQPYRSYGAFIWFIILLPFLLIWYYQRLKKFSPYNLDKETISYEDTIKTIRNTENIN